MATHKSTSDPDERPLTPEEGLQIILQATPVLETVETELDEAAGLVVATELRSEWDVPPFANSAMDGFAVRSADTGGASPEAPVELRVIGRAPAGTPFQGRVGPGEAVEIMTGAPMPEGTDAVVKVEDTSTARTGWGALSNGNGRGGQHHVLILAGAGPGTAVRRAGADTARDAVITEAGAVLTPGLIGLLASCGLGQVPVHRRPRVALCVSGDEVIAAGSATGLGPGQIFDSNSPMLRALLRSFGASVDFLGQLPDDPERMLRLLERGLAYDYLVTVGGVSMGRHDYMRECLRVLGAEEVFWRLNQQPGGPLLFGRRERTLIFGLPGNPVSCYFCAELYVQASLRRAIGHPMIAPPVAKAVLMHDLEKRHGKTAFLRARIGTWSAGLKRQFVVSTTGSQDSNLLRSVVAHQGYLVFPAGTRELTAGSTVEVIMTDHEAVARMAADLLSPVGEKNG